ncbi:MAG: (2Fe-2S)-binding protein, partial [Anaerolineae bacterium]|nr:(2Fe-2S)-binding protein [Anaerolineae bacterium]
MPSYRIETHPILDTGGRATIAFTWRGHPFTARAGEMIASALFANGVHILGYHPKDGAPQGLF